MLVEKLTKNDISIIDNFRSVYGANRDSCPIYPLKPIEDILTIWDENKGKYLYKLMGENFILEKEISYKRPVDTIRLEIADKCNYNNAMRSFRQKFKNFVNSNWDYYSDEARALMNLISCEVLATNTIDWLPEDMKTMLITVGDFSVKLNLGMKPLKALKRFATYIGAEEDFETFRISHSQILNQKVLKGTLCLSIHPMDYFTMSENNCRWTSCMNWQEPGSYRMGTVEMMNSPMVVVAYLKSDEDMTISGNDKWNNKKWRSLFIVDPTAIISIKGYPYQSEDLAKICVDWLVKLANENLEWNYFPVDKIIEGENFTYTPNGRLYHITTETAQMYNDFGAAPHYGALTTDIETEENENSPITYYFHYSGLTQCMSCGNTNRYYYDESYVYCEDCCPYESEISYCERCGCREHNDDLYWVDDMPYCSDCIDNVAAFCAIDNEYHYYDELCQVYLATEEDKPNPDTNDCIFIGQIYQRGNLRAYCNTRFNVDSPRWNEEEGIFYFNKNDLTSYGYHLYNLYNADQIARYFNNSEN